MAFAVKTHCPQGHAYDEGNTLWQRTKTGGRWKACRICLAEQQQRARARRRQAREAGRGEPGESLMSEVGLEVEADVVEPARSRGGPYKLCMECGQNVMRTAYRAGSSVCPACEARAGTPAEAGAEEPEEPEGPQELASDAEPEELEAEVVGSAAALRELQVLVHGAAAGPLTLELLAETMGHQHTALEELRRAQAEMIGRVARYGVGRGAVRPEEVPLEVAARALWLACEPLLQESLTAAMELLGLSLNRVMLGSLAFNRQEMLSQDQSLVPEAPYAVQYGTGSGRVAPGAHPVARTGLPGGRLVDGQGRLVKDCLCCGREFHPPPQRPNPDFCDEYCGTFADQLRIWATNTVLNEMRYADTEVAPQPDPRTYWEVGRCQEPYLSHALEFRAQRIEVLMAQAHEQQQKMRGL